MNKPSLVGNNFWTVETVQLIEKNVTRDELAYCSCTTGKITFLFEDNPLREYFLWGRSINAPLTPCLTSLDLSKQVNLFLIQHYETSVTGCHLYQNCSDVSPYEISWYSLFHCSLPLQRCNFVEASPLPFRYRYAWYDLISILPG